MSKGKKIYIVILLLITVLVTTFYFSYAIFSNTKEEHGKLNIVAGTLNYKIESSSLDSDSITIIANTSKEIKIKLTSLNEVSSKYELYYVLDKENENVSVGYSKDTKDNVVGTIDANKSKVITIVIRNDSNTDSKVSFQVIGGLMNNELALNDGNSLNQEVSLCRYEVGYVWNFDYTGSEQEFTTPCNGNYKLETWGAQGGFSRNIDVIGGNGGYSTGIIKINYLEKIYIDVGGAGIDGIDTSADRRGGYNGGGDSYHFSYNNCYSGSGGGATHIAIKSGLLSSLENNKNSILIVSGGGGGAGGDYTSTGTGSSFGGNGGGFEGTDSYNIVGVMNSGYGFGGNQVAGGKFFEATFAGQNGVFGKGADSTQGTNNGGSGAGGGYYGGGSGGGHFGSGGGSGYIGNPLLTDKVMYCYNCSESSEESTKTISTTCVSDNPTSNCSKKGNGYARITYLGD